jgi:ribonucleotide reductase beta subunit family protein with ferritin-like domain
MVQEAVDMEKKLLYEEVPVSITVMNMNTETISAYIEFIADQLLLSFGYDKMFNVLNPLDSI